MKLITPEYAALNRQLHENGLDYGGGYFTDPPGTATLARLAQVSDVLDYGCGQGFLKKQLASISPDLTVYEYDPAIPGKDHMPKPAGLVACFDVLEHVEPDLLENVICHIRDLTLVAAYVGVHHGAASKTLADGRNAHLIQEGQLWWAARLGKHFEIKKRSGASPASNPKTVTHSLFVLGRL